MGIWRRWVVPAENLKDMQSLPPSLIGKTDISFYSDPQSLIQKAILETSDCVKTKFKFSPQTQKSINSGL